MSEAFQPPTGETVPHFEEKKWTKIKRNLRESAMSWLVAAGLVGMTAAPFVHAPKDSPSEDPQGNVPRLTEAEKLTVRNATAAALAVASIITGYYAMKGKDSQE